MHSAHVKDPAYAKVIDFFDSTYPSLKLKSLAIGSVEQKKALQKLKIIDIFANTFKPKFAGEIFRLSFIDRKTVLEIKIELNCGMTTIWKYRKLVSQKLVEIWPYDDFKG